MKIGILQTGHFPEVLQGDHGDYEDMFARLLDGHGFTFQTWNVVDMEFPDSPQDADGWLITGSRHGAYEDLPFIPPLEDLIRAAYAVGTPMVGVCFGHQIIAQALGGKVIKVPEGWEVGRKEYDWGGETIALNAWHQDQVVETPADATVIASHPACANAALVYGNKAWSVQPHPEFVDSIVVGLSQTRGRGVVPEPILENARAQTGQLLHQSKVAHDMAAFLKGEYAA